MRVLLDMDGVLTNFEGALLEVYRKRYPDNFFVPPEKRTKFYVSDDYPMELRPLLERIYREKGFYLSLPFVDGAKEAMEDMAKRNEVYICTTPLRDFRNCIKEKYQWVYNNLGSKWVENIIATRDKTLVHADILIDDKPDVTGAIEPDWEHVIFDWPCNRDVIGKRRITWGNWKEVLKI